MTLHTGIFLALLSDENWELTLDLVPGEAKFRADNAWGTNWGAADYPSGTGVQDGDNIPIAEGGTYKIHQGAVKIKKGRKTMSPDLFQL